MASPRNPVIAPTVTYEYPFCLPSSDWLGPPTRWKAQGLLSGYGTLGMTGHWLWPKILDTAGSLQQQMAGEPYTPY
jgi:hypothetical protein